MDTACGREKIQTKDPKIIYIFKMISNETNTSEFKTPFPFTYSSHSLTGEVCVVGGRAAAGVAGARYKLLDDLYLYC